jgi:glycine betaine/proline transport system ATP-binding protein
VLRIQSGKAQTVIFVTHDLDEAIRIADRIAIMEAGRIVHIGTPEDLVLRPWSDYVRRFVAKVPPARVTRVASLMEPGGAPEGVGAPVSAATTIAAIGPRLVGGPEVLAVADSEGRPIGWLDRGRALRVLAGERPDAD